MKILNYLLAGTAMIAAAGAAAQTPPEQAVEKPDASYETSTSVPTQAEPPAEEAVDNTVTSTETAPDESVTDTATSAPAPGATATTPVAFTDTEIENFASAALKIKALEGDPSLNQQKLTAIVTESGLEPATYMAIYDAMKTNPEVANRVQIAANALQNNAG